MKIQKLVPNFDSRSTHARIYDAHRALGSWMDDVAVTDSIVLDSSFSRPFQGALAGLNSPQFEKIRSNLSLAKVGYVIEKSHFNGTLYAKVGVPVYQYSRRGYRGMLFANLACRGEDTLGDRRTIEVVPEHWQTAPQAWECHWVPELIPAQEDPDCNPFDYAQALLPESLELRGGAETVHTASLCEFLSEVFRFLNPVDRALYMDIMVQGNRFTKFLNYAASTRSHHKQEHGLLIHTAELVAHVLLDALSTPREQLNRRNPRFDLSLTLLSALLHDAAKVDEYHRLAPGVYSTNLNCELLGHEQTMLKWIAVACAVSGSYPARRELKLEHAICAVKKQHDQSGARKRKTPESFALHQADCASARAFDKGETSVLLVHRFVKGESA